MPLARGPRTPSTTGIGIVGVTEMFSFGCRKPQSALRRWVAGFVFLAVALSGTTRLAAQERGVRRAGDVLQIAIPALALAGTVGIQDSKGTAQFLKGFLTNVAATGALKLAIARERPDGSDDNSLPSGHTSAAFQGASFIHLRYGWRKGLPAYAAASFVGFSRVYADKHYVSDVLAGAALGTLSSFIFTSRFEKVEVIPKMEGGGFGLEVNIGWGLCSQSAGGSPPPAIRWP